MDGQRLLSLTPTISQKEDIQPLSPNTLSSANKAHPGILSTLTTDQLRHSTAEIYHQPNPPSPNMHDLRNYHPTFARHRVDLDYTYHLLPTIERQSVQDRIIQHILSTQTKRSASLKAACCQDQQQGVKGKKPVALFTAGGMGAGKGHSLQYFIKHGIIDLDPDFVWSVSGPPSLPHFFLSFLLPLLSIFAAWCI